MATENPVQRCAIYTRKSSEEGLEQEFNSLHAQREAAQAYIESQRHEGWQLVDDHYDDGGFSGGNMDRPALSRLLKDIERKRIDTVVVYKIDRLTRSLADFARLVELFDQHQVTFVAVTQQFNTTTSMGRLTLNILLSFAQFERELTSERIRDKFALSRKKGKWMGGIPPLGYRVHERKLLIDDQEVGIVRLAFSLFIETGSVLATSQRLNEQGFRTRTILTVNGKRRGGQAFTTTYLYKLLHNRTYLGEVGHKGQWYPGEHPALISLDLWQQAHQALERGAAARRREQEWKNSTAMLKGLLVDPEGIALVPTHTRRRGKLHRYYISNQALKLGYEEAPFPPVPAEPLEAIVLETVRELLITPETLYTTWKIAQQTEHPLTEEQVSTGLNTLGDIWRELFPEEQARLMELMVQKIEVSKEAISLDLHSEGVLEAAMELNQEGGSP